VKVEQSSKDGTKKESRENFISKKKHDWQIKKIEKQISF